jgi:hypothetical protein
MIHFFISNFSGGAFILCCHFAIHVSRKNMLNKAIPTLLFLFQHTLYSICLYLENKYFPIRTGFFVCIQTTFARCTYSLYARQNIGHYFKGIVPRDSVSTVPTGG